MSMKPNEPIEVTKKQYDRLIVDCAGIIAHRAENGRYWIKLMMPKFKHFVKL